MGAFKKYFISNCLSFTLVTVIYAVLSKYGVVYELRDYTLLQFFCITTAICLLMYLTDRIPVKTLAGGIAFDLLCVAAVVYTLGPLFGMFPMEWPILLLVAGMIAVVYAGVFAVFYVQNKAAAESINKKLSKQRRKGDETRDNGKGD